MADYGHDLILGTSLSPRSQRPREVAGLASLDLLSGGQVAPEARISFDLNCQL